MPQLVRRVAALSHQTSPIKPFLRVPWRPEKYLRFRIVFALAENSYQLGCTVQQVSPASNTNCPAGKAA